MPRLEPMYPLNVAAELIPFPSVDSLYTFLSRHREEFPPRYRRWRGVQSRRMLLLSECVRIRQMTVKPYRYRQR